jgi:periplasmic protein TonB
VVAASKPIAAPQQATPATEAHRKAADRESIAASSFASLLFHALILVLLIGWGQPAEPPEVIVPEVRLLVLGNGAEGAAGSDGGDMAAAGNAASAAPEDAAAAPTGTQAPPAPPATAPAPPPETQPRVPQPTIAITQAPEPAPQPLPPLPRRKPTPPKPHVDAALEPPPPVPTPPPVAHPPPQPPAVPAPAPAPTAVASSKPAGNAAEHAGLQGGTDAAGGRGQGAKGGGRDAFGNGDLDAIGNDWLERARRRMLPFLIYPSEAKDKKEEGTVGLDITVARDGTVVGVAINKTSGYPLLDAAALKMVHDASPLPPVPDQISGERLTFAIPQKFTIGAFDRLFR